MNRSFFVNIKTKKGKVMKILRESYIRDFMSCNSDACDSCETESNERITLSSQPYDHRYLIVDEEVLINQIDLLQQDIPPLCDVIILQSVLTEIRKRNVGVFNQISSLLRNSSKRFSVFANQNFERTYLDRDMDESEADYQLRLVVAASKYFNEHFSPYNIRTVILTNHSVLQQKYLESQDIECVTISMLVDSIKETYPALSDHMNITSIEFGESKTGETPLQITESWDSQRGMYNLVKEQGDGIYYYNYLDQATVNEGLEAGRLYKATFHSNVDNIREGRVNLHMDGGEVNVLISGRLDINRAIDGDQVIVELYPKSQWKAESEYLMTNDQEEEKAEEDKTESNAAVSNGEKETTGRVVAIARRNWREYCGSLEPVAEGTIHNYYLFDPVSRRIPKIRIKTNQYTTLLNQRIVIAINDWPTNSLYPVGHYIRSLGQIGDREVETQVLLLEHAIPSNVFSKEVLDCLPPADWHITEDNARGRLDLREKACIVSIDPPGCKDIDDALHARRLENGNIEVGVHIADVTYYVKHNSPLDLEARNRSTSTYLVDRRLDMLPKLLTENLCSLVANQDRFAFSVIAEMTPTADVVSARFHKTIIRSRGALTYQQAQDYLDKKDSTSEIGHSIHLLFNLSRELKNRRLQAGALSLASPEVRFEMDSETNDPLSMDSYKLKDTNSLVEEFMLFANTLVAKRIAEAFPVTAVLRRHPIPDMCSFYLFVTLRKRFDHLVRVAQRAGFTLHCESNKQLADSLDKAVIPSEPLFNKLLRILTTRCMTQAVYFPAGEVPSSQYYHYGLAAPIYTHFTSPIRRYADDVVHRLLAAAEGLSPLPEEFGDKEAMKAMTDVENMNMRHYNAQIAGRESVELFTIIFFSKKKEKAAGLVMGCKKNGIKVWVPQYGIEGMIFINHTNKKNLLNENYNSDFEFDPETGVLTNTHDPSDTIETFQPITVGIHVQEMKGFRRELILSLLSSSAFKEEKEEKSKKGKKELKEKKEKEGKVKQEKKERREKK